MRFTCFTQRLVPLALALLALPAFAQRVVVAPSNLAQLSVQLPQRATSALQLLRGESAKLGLDGNADFAQLAAHTDEFGMAHVRFQQLYNNVPVFGGEIVTHANPDGSFDPHTNALRVDVRVSTKPTLTGQQAQAVAIARFQRDSVVQRSQATPTPSSASLYVYPVTELTPVDGEADPAKADATRFVERLVRTALVYQVRVTGAAGQAMYYLVDAHNGAVLKSWAAVHTDTATGYSQYSGIVTVQQARDSAGRVILADRTRGTIFGSNPGAGYTVVDAAGTLVNTAPPVWGNGKNFYSGIDYPDAKSYQTAGVDVAFGLARTHDLYKNVFKWVGKDGRDAPMQASVHQFTEGNAYYDPLCDCLTFGEGYHTNPSYRMTSLTSLDVVAHEMTHAVTQHTARLIYAGESGALNEATSDVMSMMALFYSKGAGGIGTVVPQTGGDWIIGNAITNFPKRYMYKPSLDGRSVDAWGPAIGAYDVHYSSGVGNRAFYFMSQGAASTGDRSSPLLPSGMTGIGNDKAARIWFRALTTYMPANSIYATARQAMILAARDLYGSGSAAEIAVWNAWHGVNVGPAWGASGSACGRLENTALYAGKSVKSCSGQYALTMQPNGDLQYVKLPSTVIWRTGTSTPNSYAYMQGDGNLVVYAPSALKALWNSGTWWEPAASLEVGDGNLVIWGLNGVPVWYLTKPAGTELLTVTQDSSYSNPVPMPLATTGVIGRFAAGGSYQHVMRFDYVYGDTIEFSLTGQLTPNGNEQWVISLLDYQGQPLLASDGWGFSREVKAVKSGQSSAVATVRWKMNSVITAPRYVAVQYMSANRAPNYPLAYSVKVRRFKE